MIPALEIPADIDLRLFSSFLSQVGTNHRITDAGVNQVVWVDDEEVRDRVLLYYSQMSSGEVVLEDESGTRTGRLSLASRLVSNIWRFPLTMLLILVNLLLFPLSLNIGQVDLLGFFSQLTFLQFDENSLQFTTLTETMQAHEYWRLLTPMFIHFGLLHLAFNMLSLYRLGSQIENLQGTRLFLGLVALTQIPGALVQFGVSGPLFGGMSGVVYGLFGFCWMQARYASRGYSVSGQDTMWIMGWFVLCATGLVGHIANAQHALGLFFGLLAGMPAYIAFRRSSAKVPFAKGSWADLNIQGFQRFRRVYFDPYVPLWFVGLAVVVLFVG